MVLGWILLLLGISCAREEAETAANVPGNEKLVTIRVSMPENAYGTKVSFTDEDGVLKTSWQSTDCIRVISGSKSAVYDISNVVSAHVAEFQGPAVSGSSFDVLFPGTYASVAEAESDTQLPAQTGNGSTEHLRMRALLQGVDQYEELLFKSDWAAAHGGSFRQGAALKLVAELPDGVSTVKSVGIGLGGKNYSMPLNGVDVSASGQELTAYLMLPWADIELPDGTDIPISVTDTGNDVYSTVVTVNGDKTVLQGKMNSIGTQSIVSLELQDFAGGKGTQAEPYLIANARQLNNMHKDGVLVGGEIHYFTLIEDIDASGIANWVPLNNTGTFDKGIFLDGAGHTISGLKSSGVAYASFAGVLYGHIENLNFSGATINATSKCGVVAGFLGTATNDYARVATCSNVTVSGSTVTSTSAAGGFAGHLRGKGGISGCKVVGTTVNGTSHLGGFVAIADISGVEKYEVPAIFTSCEVENVTVNQNQTSASSAIYTGGFIGETYQAHSFIDCSVKASTITATKAAVGNVGGFVGYTDYAGANFQNCSVDAASSVNAKGNHVGGFVGYANVPDAYKNCSSSAPVTNTAEYTGGFAGYAAGSASFSGCHAIGNVTGYLHAGGFVGTAENASFVDSWYENGTVSASGTTKGTQSAGFCGYATKGVSFNGCYVKNATVTSGGQRIGGFIGQLGYSYSSSNNITLDQCSVQNTAVSGGTNTGGFAGVQYDNVSRSYVSGGSVTAKGAHCGGFIGFSQQGRVSDCYSTASVTGGSQAQVGGFIGILYDSVVSCCYVSGSISGSGTDWGAFVGQCALQGSPGTIVNCIAWNDNLPFYGSNPANASITDGYAGTSGTVSSRAEAQGWSEGVWNLSGSQPQLLDVPRRIPAIFVGDSITWQWARNSNTFATSKLKIPFDSSYMTKSGDNVTVSFHPGFFAGNGYLDKGISGQNTTQMLSRFDKDVVALNPVVVVIMGGTNDLAQGVSETGIRDNIAAMAQKASAAGIKVVLCSVTPNDDTYSRLSNPKTKGAHIVTLNGLIKTLAAGNGYTYCNYWDSLVTDASSDLSLKTEYRLYDNLHPGPAGYDVMEPIIKNIIDGLL